MQHREIFTTKYLREIGKHFDLSRDVPDLDAVRRHVADWQISYHNGTIIRQSEIQLQKEFLNTFFVECLGYRGKIGRYDYDSDLNVSILGHIFEQSIGDIEERKAEIAGTPTEKKQGKRKKDGIFYTPEYDGQYLMGLVLRGLVFWQVFLPNRAAYLSDFLTGCEEQPGSNLDDA